jgi:hypothetical protein
MAQGSGRFAILAYLAADREKCFADNCIFEGQSTLHLGVDFSRYGSMAATPMAGQD